MRKYQRTVKQNTEKKLDRELMEVQAELPMEELLAGIRNDIEAFSAEVGLKIIEGVMEQELNRKTGPWGKQCAWRHGHQTGYVIFSGRKVPSSARVCAIPRASAHWPATRPFRRTTKCSRPLPESSRANAPRAITREPSIR